MHVLPDKTGPVIDSRGSFVPHSLDSIVLDQKGVMKAGGNLKRAKRYCSQLVLMVFTYRLYTMQRVHIHLTTEKLNMNIRDASPPLHVLIWSTCLLKLTHEHSICGVHSELHQQCQGL